MAFKLTQTTLTATITSWDNAPAGGPRADQARITDETVVTDWSFITAVHHDNNIAEFYRNVVLVGSDSSFPAKFHLLKIGINRGGWPGNRNSDTGHNLWKGYVDEVKIYGRALSQTEVNNLYNRDYP